MSSVKLKIEYGGGACVVSCDYQPEEPENNVGEELTLTDLEVGELHFLHMLNALQLIEVDALAHEKFAEFMQADYIAKQERDSSPNPFGEWV